MRVFRCKYEWIMHNNGVRYYDTYVIDKHFTRITLQRLSVGV